MWKWEEKGNHGNMGNGEKEDKQKSSPLTLLINYCLCTKLMLLLSSVMQINVMQCMFIAICNVIHNQHNGMHLYHHAHMPLL